MLWNPAERRVADLEDEGVLLVEDGNHGEYRPRPSEFGRGQTHFIRASDMDDGRILFNTADRIDEVATRRIRKGIGKGGDVLFSHKGTVGKLAVAPPNSPPFVCSPQTTFWRVLDENMLDRRYLYYFMKSAAFAQQWRSRKGETDMADYVSLTTQRELRVLVPEIGEQRAIGSMLGVLDEKIELNREVNRTLAAMVEALYRSWFVDFDPVAAKAAGEKPCGVSGDTEALFSDRFVDSELGPIPEGWKARKLEKAVVLIPGRSYSSSELRESRIALVTLKSFRRGGGYREGGLKPYTGRFKAEQTVDPGELVLARTDVTQAAEVIGRPAIVREDPRFQTFVASLDLLIVRPRGHMSTPFLYWLMKTADFESHVLGHANGTTVLHLSKEAVPSYVFADPGSDLVESFSRLAEPAMLAVYERERQDRTLVELRDSLLSELFSGAVCLRHVEKVVQEAM